MCPVQSPDSSVCTMGDLCSRDMQGAFQPARARGGWTAAARAIPRIRMALIDEAGGS